jgi:hypothetical protein
MYCWGDLSNTNNDGYILPIFGSNLQDLDKDYIFIENNNGTITTVSSGDWIKNSKFFIKYPTFIGGFNYDVIFKEIADIDDKVRYLKHKINESNCVTMLAKFNITIDTALVMLAQLNNKKEILSRLVNYDKLSRKTTYNGVIEYSETAYEIERAKKDYEDIQKMIFDLQMDLDRTNLNTFIEVDIDI